MPTLAASPVVQRQATPPPSLLPCSRAVQVGSYIHNVAQACKQHDIVVVRAQVPVAAGPIHTQLDALAVRPYSEQPPSNSAPTLFSGEQEWRDCRHRTQVHTAESHRTQIKVRHPQMALVVARANGGTQLSYAVQESGHAAAQRARKQRVQCPRVAVRLRRGALLVRQSAEVRTDGLRRWHFARRTRSLRPTVLWDASLWHAVTAPSSTAAACCRTCQRCQPTALQRPNPRQSCPCLLLPSLNLGVRPLLSRTPSQYLTASRRTSHRLYDPQERLLQPAPQRRSAGRHRARQDRVPLWCALLP